MAANRIVIKSGSDARYIEGEAGVAIPPGSACILTSDGTYDPWNGTSGDQDETLIAVEDALQGAPQTQSIAIGDIVTMFVPKPGDECYIRIEDGQTLAVAALVSKNTVNGTHIAATGAEPDFKMLEASSPTGSDDLALARKL